MSLEKASIGWSAKQLKVMVTNGKINFDHIVQRSYVWEKERKSHLIESMILGYPIPPIYAKRADGDGTKGSNTYYIMDGKQRLSTIKEYLNDEFELSNLPTITYMDEEKGAECKADVSGLKFSELPEALRDYLNTVMLTVTYFDNLTKEEERELFKRLNAGKPLSVKNKVLASCKDLEKLLEIGEHPIFKDMFSSKALDNKNQVTTIMKIWCMLFMDNLDDISFESKSFNPLLESVTITPSQEDSLKHVLNRAYIVKNLLMKENKRAAKWFMKETHFVSICSFIPTSLDNKTNEEVADFIAEFYYDISNGKTKLAEDYVAACNSGSAKSKNIKIRDNIIADFYNNFF